MGKYTINEFIKQTKQDERESEYFELETPRILEVNLTDLVWAKTGSMVSYTGNIKFERERMLEHGVGMMFKKAFTGEGTSLMKATGNGRLYLADQGKKITIFDLDNESITVNGNDLLAFEPSIEWDIKLMRKVAGMTVQCEVTGQGQSSDHHSFRAINATRPARGTCRNGPECNRSLVRPFGT